MKISVLYWRKLLSIYVEIAMFLFEGGIRVLVLAILCILLLLSSNNLVDLITYCCILFTVVFML